MKKILLTMAFVLTALGNAWADDVTVDNITIPKGSSATLKIYLENSSQYRQQFQFDLELPNGITVLTGTEKLNLDRFKNKTADPASLRCEQQSSSDPNKSIVRFLAKEDDDDLIEGSEGIIMTVQLLAASTLDKGVALTGNITGIEVTTHDSQAFRPSNKSFNITIGEPLEQVTLDENSTVAPSARSNVDVVVYRTINASVWSTICLPFDMSAAQVKEAFGDDVKLADLAGWSFTGLAASADNINIVFSPVTAIEKNHPYMIKVSSKITQFSLNNIVIDPVVEPALPMKSVNYQVGRTPYSCSMFGTYVYGDMYAGDFFVSGNKFWLNEHDGDNTIKAFRCTFGIGVTLSENAGSRIAMSFEEKATDINDINVADDSSDEYYNLQGQRVDTPAKGVFIKGGKKILVK